MQNGHLRLSLIVTTHERPDALAAVLASIMRQEQPPDEVIVADDGSGDATRAVIERFASAATVPVHHVCQEHLGFRLSRLRNLAAASASGDYLVFIDGDMLLHPMFVSDHRHHARPGAFTQGVRIPLDEHGTGRVLARPHAPPELSAADFGGRRRLYALHSPALARLMRRLGNPLIAIKSCNMGLWRRDLEAVNGFNEDMTGWGYEDKELSVRLRNGGITRQTLIFGGIAYHLHHPPAAREHRARNERIYAAARSQRLVRCASGLDAHPRSLASADIHQPSARRVL